MFGKILRYLKCKKCQCPELVVLLVKTCIETICLNFKGVLDFYDLTIIEEIPKRRTKLETTRAVTNPYIFSVKSDYSD